MSDTIEIIRGEMDDTENQSTISDRAIAASSSGSPYFRYKGLKVKYEDIENVLCECELVSKAAVISIEDIEGNRTLASYIVPNGPFDQISTSNYLAKKVPQYMVPELWIPVESLPLTTSGNIDKQALSKLAVNKVNQVEYLAPRTPFEEKLAGIIQDVLGIQTISILDNFFTLGGGSLQAVRVISALRNLQVNLDVKHFFVYPTIAQLADYIQAETSKDTPTNSGENVEEAFYPGNDNWILKKSIVPLKTGNGKMPLYIVCGGGGTAFTFEKFAYMLDEDQPVYVFQPASDVEELEQFPNAVEGIASKYVDEILSIDPSGSYALSGHCIGGVIALEMARKLQGMGKKIKILAMFDVILSGKNNAASLAFKNFYNIPGVLKKATSKAYLKMDLETFLFTRHPKDALNYKVNRIKALVNRVWHIKNEDPQLKIFRRFEEKFKEAFDNYQVNKYDGDILVFYAKDHYYFLDRERKIQFRKTFLGEDTKNRWKDYGKNVTLFEIEGEHSTIFYSQNFATILQQHLRG